MHGNFKQLNRVGDHLEAEGWVEWEADELNAKATLKIEVTQTRPGVDDVVGKGETAVERHTTDKTEWKAKLTNSNNFTPGGPYATGHADAKVKVAGKAPEDYPWDSPVPPGLPVP